MGKNGEHVFFKMLKEDIDTVFDQDPAARSYIEVVLTYSGLHAIWAHRIAHAFYKRKLYFIARIISQVSRFSQGWKFIRRQPLAGGSSLITAWAS